MRRPIAIAGIRCFSDSYAPRAPNSRPLVGSLEVLDSKVCEAREIFGHARSQ